MGFGDLSYRPGSSRARERLIIPDSITDTSRITRSETWRASTNIKSPLKKSIDRYLMNFKNKTGMGIHVLILGFFWIICTWYMETRFAKSSIQQCHWHSKEKEPWQSRIVLIADPQLVDDNTYPGRPKPLLRATQYIVDTYLRRNWVYTNQVLDADAYIFLGDLFDGGREWNNTMWYEEFDRFTRIFTKPWLKRTLMNVAGNHDIGYGDSIVPDALKRFRALFGEGNMSIKIGNHSIVFLDTISMMNTKHESIYGPPREFMDEIAQNQDTDPKILMTHVPLFRPPGTSCGSKRESSKDLSYTYGYQYQTQIPPEVTNEILEKIQPVAIFSGDDHDACFVNHSYYLNNNRKWADEYTVKSFSMAMGISAPGIQLLELDGRPGIKPEESFSTSICLMPSPFAPFIIYGLLAALTLCMIVIFNLFPSLLPVSLQDLHSYDSGKRSDLPLYKEKRIINMSSTRRKRLLRTAYDIIFFLGLFTAVSMYLRRQFFSKNSM